MRASLPATIEIKQYLNSEKNVCAGATNIHQVLMNLCTNAGHAMRNTGGVLTVRLVDAQLEEKDMIQHIGVGPGKYMKISVEDTGHGIPRDIQKRVFDPFFTTKALGEGTGMGLSAAHGIVRELGGVVTLTSEVGKGTVFDVLLPVIMEVPRTKMETMAASIEMIAGGTERILFVDDEQLQQELARESLGRMGYTVKVFSDSVAAFEHFEKNVDAYDLVVTDMTMPKMTGDILAKKIRAIRPGIPVVLCTGFSEVMDEHKAKAINISAFLYKPIVSQTLLRTIRKILDTNRDRADSNA
jgi:two-component system, cell cycle sensor histidine kinase and response regulator CckA